MDVIDIDVTETEAEELRLDENISGLVLFYSQLTRMIEWRTNDKLFTELVDYLSTLKDEKISFISDEELDRQLRLCSQWKFTLAQIKSELTLYKKKMTRHFRTWYAIRSQEAKKAILSNQKSEITMGTRTKSNYGGMTKDDILDYILCNHSDEHEKRQMYIDRVERSEELISNMVDDIKHRSICLMAVSRKIIDSSNNY